jgi:hypothetical protein
MLASNQLHWAVIGHFKHVFCDFRGVMEKYLLAHAGNRFDIARKNHEIMADHNNGYVLVQFL